MGAVYHRVLLLGDESRFLLTTIELLSMAHRCDPLQEDEDTWEIAALITSTIRRPFETLASLFQSSDPSLVEDVSAHRVQEQSSDPSAATSASLLRPVSDYSRLYAFPMCFIPGLAISTQHLHVKAQSSHVGSIVGNAMMAPNHGMFKSMFRTLNRLTQGFLGSLSQTTVLEEHYFLANLPAHPDISTRLSEYFPESRTEDTRCILEWAGADHQPPELILCVLGKVGVGKSTLAKHLADQLRQDKRLGRTPPYPYGCPIFMRTKRRPKPPHVRSLCTQNPEK